MSQSSREVVLDSDERQRENVEKLDRLERLMAEQQLDAVLISRNENIAWVTGGAVNLRVGLLRETAAGSLLITKDRRAFYLTTDNELDRFAAEEFAQLNFEPLVQPWYANDVQGSIRKAVGAGRVGADAPLGSVEAISLQPLRLELTDAELRRYRWLGQHAAEAASEVLLGLEPGVSEAEMQARLAQRLISGGMLPSVFLCAVDERIYRYRHAVPRAGILERFGMIGFCARRWGLTVSMTRFVHFGPIPEDLAARFAAVALVNASLLSSTQEGASSDHLFEVAAEAYASAGYPGGEKLHHQGGATGYAEREWLARPGGHERVLNQQAFAWNPSLYGAKVEDTVLLQRGMQEVLTKTPELPVVQTSLNGKSYVSAGVLEG